MDNSGKYWTVDEDNQLKKLHPLMGISDIAHIHKRSEYSIACRLVKLKVINSMEEINILNPIWINPTWDLMLNTMIKKLKSEGNKHPFDIMSKIYNLTSEVINNTSPNILNNDKQLVQHQIFELCTFIDSLKQEINDLNELLNLKKID